MEALYTESFIISEKFNGTEVLMFLLASRSFSPCKFIWSYKIRKPDKRDSLEGFFMGVVNAMQIVLPPKALKRRHNEIKVSLNSMAAFFGHLYGISNAIVMNKW